VQARPNVLLFRRQIRKACRQPKTGIQYTSFFTQCLLSMSGLKFQYLLVEYNRRQLSRIYPAGGRVDSSNYPPHLHWNAGCQIVAFNFQVDLSFRFSLYPFLLLLPAHICLTYLTIRFSSLLFAQTLDRTMQLNIGKYQENGGTGYLLKPEWMLKDGGEKPSAKKLQIRVISGQQLPKPGQSSKGEVIDPYVEVDISGEPEDCVSKKTKTINDNGFNPIWDETFDFSVKSPDLTLVRFAVYVSFLLFPLPFLLFSEFPFPFSCFSFHRTRTWIAMISLHLELFPSTV